MKDKTKLRIIEFVEKILGYRKESIYKYHVFGGQKTAELKIAYSSIQYYREEWADHGYGNENNFISRTKRELVQDLLGTLSINNAFDFKSTENQYGGIKLECSLKYLKAQEVEND